MNLDKIINSPDFHRETHIFDNVKIEAKPHTA